MYILFFQPANHDRNILLQRLPFKPGEVLVEIHPQLFLLPGYYDDVAFMRKKAACNDPGASVEYLKPGPVVLLHIV